MTTEFTGCKLAYFCHGQLLVYKRDNKPMLAFADMWDLPGGGREGSESPEECVLRELQEEFALNLPASRLLCKWQVTNHLQNGLSYFFVASGCQQELDTIVFGDEGQYWQLMDIDELITRTDVVPMHKLGCLGSFNNCINNCINN